MHENADTKLLASLENFGEGEFIGKHLHAILSIFSDQGSLTLIGQTGEQQRLADMLQKAASDLQQRINSEREEKH